MFNAMMSDLADLATAEAWMAEGLCSQTDPDAFFPADQAGPRWWRDAVRVCADCPVRADCLAYALDAGEEWGVWGGTTSTDRQLMRPDLAA